MPGALVAVVSLLAVLVSHLLSVGRRAHTGARRAYPRAVTLSVAALATSLLTTLLTGCGADVTAPSRTAVAPRTASYDAAAFAGAATYVGPLMSAVNGQCLSGLNGAGALWVAPCVSAAANQTWTAPPTGTAGTITIHGGAMCLTGYAGAAFAMPGGTWVCTLGGASQQFTLTAAGELRSATGYCLTYFSSNGTFSLRSCDGGASQRWTQASSDSEGSSRSGTTGLASAVNGRCLTAATGPGALWTGPCVSGAAEQSWVVPAVGTAGAVTIHGGTMCLTGYGGGTFAMPGGTWSCALAGASQQFTLTAAGELRIATGGYCLTYFESNGTFSLRTCDGGAAQRWLTTAAGAAPVPPTPAAPAAPAAPPRRPRRPRRR